MSRLLCDILVDLGVRRSVSVNRGEDALLRLSHRRFDAVIVDSTLTEMNSIELIGQIRFGFADERRMTPVLLTVSLPTIAIIREARDAGVDDILLKPLTIGGLTSKLLKVTPPGRTFVETATYCGPDRRRHARATARTPRRRKDDRPPGDILV